MIPFQSKHANQKLSKSKTPSHLCKLILIIFFIKYELINEQLVSGKAKALIYNKDGKFIYRPAKASQGHIIVIDDRHQDNNNNNNYKNQASAGAESAFQPYLMSPRMYQPSESAAANMRPAGYYPGTGSIQLVSLAELPSVAHPDSRFYPAAGPQPAQAAVLQPAAASPVQVVPLAVRLYSPTRQTQTQPMASMPINKPQSFDYYPMASPVAQVSAEYSTLPANTNQAQQNTVDSFVAQQQFIPQLVGYRPIGRQQQRTLEPQENPSSYGQFQNSFGLDMNAHLQQFQDDPMIMAQRAPNVYQSRHSDGNNNNFKSRRLMQSLENLDESNNDIIQSDAFDDSPHSIRTTVKNNPRQHGKNFDLPPSIPGYISPPAPNEDESFRSFEKHKMSNQQPILESSGEKKVSKFLKRHQHNKQKSDSKRNNNAATETVSNQTNTFHNVDLNGKDSNSNEYWSQFKDQYDFV